MATARADASLKNGHAGKPKTRENQATTRLLSVLARGSCLGSS